MSARAKTTFEKGLIEAVREAIESAPKRRFVESVDLTVVLRNVDLKRNPNLKLNEVVTLPNPPKNKAPKVAVIGRGDFSLKAREAGADIVLEPEDVERIAKDKRELKKLASRFDFFVSQADLIPRLARFLGPVLGPRNKMPMPLPANQVDRLPEIISKLRRSVRIRMRDQPMFHVKVGSADMTPEEIAENAEAVISAVEKKYGDLNYIESIYVKTTMGPAVSVRFTPGARRGR